MRITDEKIAPFFIKTDENNFTVCEPTPTEKAPDGYKVHGHFGTLETALLKIGKLKTLASLDGQTVSIDQYTGAIRAFLDSFRQLLSI